MLIFNIFQAKSNSNGGKPFAASDLVYFRKRIGEKGIEIFFKHFIDTYGKDSQDSNVSIDSTVQEKNIRYPTDSKLQQKIIDNCIKIVKQEGIILRRSYKRTAKQLFRDTYCGYPKRRKKANAAKRKLKTIAVRLIRELERKLPKTSVQLAGLKILKKVGIQTQKSSQKIYSLHEPEVYCIAK
jgi:IS5 family transposase